MDETDHDTPARWVRWLTIHDDGRLVVEEVVPRIADGGYTVRLVIVVPPEWRMVQGDVTIRPKASRA